MAIDLDDAPEFNRIKTVGEIVQEGDPRKDSFVEYALRGLIEEAREQLLKQVGINIPTAEFIESPKRSFSPHPIFAQRRAMRVMHGEKDLRWRDSTRLRRGDIEEALNEILGTEESIPAFDNNAGTFHVSPSKKDLGIELRRLEEIPEKPNRTENAGLLRAIKGSKGLSGARLKNATHVMWGVEDADFDPYRVRSVAPTILSKNDLPKGLHLVRIPEATQSTGKLSANIARIVREMRSIVRREIERKAA